MRPISHVIASAAGIPVYMYTNSIELAVCFGLAEVMIDMDHVIDHFFFSKRPLTFATFFERENATRWSRIVFFLHSYEVVMILASLGFWFKNSIFLAVSAGMFFHLLLDEIGNRLPGVFRKIKAPFYFFTYRLCHRFQVNDITVKNDRSMRLTA